MELIYRHSESMSRPEQVQIAGNTAYLRKSIKEEKRGKDIYWVYEEAPIPLEEFNRNANALIMINQINSDDERLTIMEAMADLYELLLTQM